MLQLISKSNTVLLSSNMPFRMVVSFCFFSCGWFYICICFSLFVLVLSSIFPLASVFVICCVCLSICVCILKGNTLSLWPWTVGWAQPSRRGSGASLHCARRCSTVHQALQGHPHLHCLQSYHRSYLAHIGTSSTLPPSCHWFLLYRTIWHYDKALMFISAPILCCHHRPEGFQAQWETES